MTPSSPDILVAAIDIETTGILDPEHRILEIYIDLLRGRNRVFSFNQRVDPGRAISAEAQRVHGITMSDLIGKPTWSTVGPAVFKVLSKASGYVWHNGDEFDGPFIHQELTRIGLHLPPRPSHDTMKLGVWATPNGKKPNLSELCFACGVPYDPALAHAADYDVHKMEECYWLGQDWGFYPTNFPAVTAHAS